MATSAQIEWLAMLYSLQMELVHYLIEALIIWNNSYKKTMMIFYEQNNLSAFK